MIDILQINFQWNRQEICLCSPKTSSRKNVFVNFAEQNVHLTYTLYEQTPFVREGHGINTPRKFLICNLYIKINNQ